MNNLKAKTIRFRLAEPDDARFIYSLRVNKKLSEHISKVTGTEIQQREWLEAYKLRENSGSEVYFIIERLDTSIPIGTVRLYGFIDAEKFCWGSWILNENKTRTAAIESAYLVYKYAFDVCGFELAYFQVDKNNELVISFHEKTGAILVSEDGVNNNYEFTLDCYERFKVKFRLILKNK
ncbi:MAG: GNAT family N-acetyltransferase [Hafnia sp.]